MEDRTDRVTGMKLGKKERQQKPEKGEETAEQDDGGWGWGADTRQKMSDKDSKET